jgi:deoxyribose-phosphate aldolase
MPADEDRFCLASVIDHTLLTPDAMPSDIERLCEEALEWNFMAVCINPFWVPFAAELLEGGLPIVCSVAGFPLGATTAKALEASRAVEDGAGEIDMVLNAGLLRSGDTARLESEIADVVRASQGVPVKVILETCLLNDREKREACIISENAGALWVKTSTGFGARGATTSDVRLMSDTVGGRIGVKASGGIRTRADAIAMLEAGAGRLGCSRSIEIVSAPAGS